MNDAQNIAPVVRFASFEVNFCSRELHKHGMRIRMEEKPFQILEMLLESPGQVVTRKLLREKLWPDTYVGYERAEPAIRRNTPAAWLSLHRSGHHARQICSRCQENAPRSSLRELRL